MSNLQEAIKIIQENAANCAQSSKNQQNISQGYTPHTQPPAPPNSKTKLQELIRQERKNQKLSQRGLAQRAGCSQGTITRAERHLWISLHCLINIVKALGKELTFK